MKAIVSTSVGDFCRSVKTNGIFTQLEQAFRAAKGYSVQPAERASWLGSLPRLSGAIELAGLPIARSSDSKLRSHTLRAKPQDVASVYLRRIYRALFTRPLLALRVFSVDKETRAFLRSQVEKRPLVARPVRDGTGAVVLPFRRLDSADPAPGEIPVQLHLLKLTTGRPDLFQYEQTPEWVILSGARKVEPGRLHRGAPARATLPSSGTSTSPSRIRVRSFRPFYQSASPRSTR